MHFSHVLLLFILYPEVHLEQVGFLPYSYLQFKQNAVVILQFIHTFSYSLKYFPASHKPITDDYTHYPYSLSNYKGWSHSRQVNSNLVELTFA